MPFQVTNPTHHPYCEAVKMGVGLEPFKIFYYLLSDSKNG